MATAKTTKKAKQKDSKKKRSNLWNVYRQDSATGERVLVWVKISKKEVLERWTLWNERDDGSILIPEPCWFREKIPRRWIDTFYFT